jgi:hypothetical protein
MGIATATLAVAAAPTQGFNAASRAGAAGTSYGGVPAQDFPVVVDVNRRRTRVVRAVIAIRLSCTAGGSVSVPDGYTRRSIRRGKFSASFGPVTQRNDDGTTAKPCLECGRITTGSRCPSCRRASPYQQPAWRRLSDFVVARDGSCRECGSTRYLAAHHVIPRTEGGADHPPTS